MAALQATSIPHFPPRLPIEKKQQGSAAASDAANGMEDANAMAEVPPVAGQAGFDPHFVRVVRETLGCTWFLTEGCNDAVLFSRGTLPSSLAEGEKRDCTQTH